MSAVKRIKVKNRLAAVVRMPGGKTVAEAVAGAELQLEAIKDDCVSALDASLAAMNLVANSLKAGHKPEQLSELYDLANDVIGVASVAGHGSVGDAAYSLCELLDNFMEASQWNWAAVEVHMNGLKLLRAMGDKLGEAEREQVLEGLRAVVRRLGGGDSEPQVA
jgi:hypothetical protein